MKLLHIAKATGLGAAVLVLSAGAALAAVATASVNVRSGPGTGYRVLDTLSPGERVAVVDRDGSWCAVEKSGADGWVSCRYLSDSIRFRDNFRNGPSVSLSFGVGVRPDRPRRPHRGDYWYWNDSPNWWDHRPPGSMFSLSLGN